MLSNAIRIGVEMYGSDADEDELILFLRIFLDDDVAVLVPMSSLTDTCVVSGS